MTIKTTIFTHCPRVSLARCPFCRWRHNRSLMMSQWPDNCDAVTWKVISNSLDIDFIYGDIHGRTCKNVYLFIYSIYAFILQWHFYNAVSLANTTALPSWPVDILQFGKTSLNLNPTTNIDTSLNMIEWLVISVQKAFIGPVVWETNGSNHPDWSQSYFC